MTDVLTHVMTAWEDRHMTQKVWNADAARFDKAFRAADALVTTDDGFTYIDESKVPAALVRSYRRFMQHGYANGLV